MTVVAFVGSRDWFDPLRVRNYVWRVARRHPEAVIVSGGARGVDREAEKMAELLGLEVISYRPYEFDSIYDKKLYSIDTHTTGERAQEIVVAKSRRINTPTFNSYGGAAIFRNGWIASDVSENGALVAFWDGKSSGTRAAIRLSLELGKMTIQIGPGKLIEGAIPG